MKLYKLFFYPCFTPNIFGILTWVFAVFVMGIPQVHDDNKSKPLLFAVLASILLVWAMSNDYSELLRPFKKWFIVVKVVNCLVIPFIVIFFVVKNGIFQMRVSGIDLNLSCVPIIFQIYLILFLYEFIYYLKKRCTEKVKLKILKKTILALTVVLLAFCNIYFCVYFVASWGAWYRSLYGILD